MEAFTSAWFTALFSIIIIDLVLAGDNAVAIALAARSLPRELQRKAIIWGTFGAVAIRILMTLGVVYLMQIPGLKLAGGIGLLYIAIKLLQPHKESQSHEHTHQAIGGASLSSALKTIVIADALMGLDNVLAIAGAAKDDFGLVVLGLLISIPIVVFGSALAIKLINRFPLVIYIGSGILAYTAASMIFTDNLLAPYFSTLPTIFIYVIYVIIVVVTLMLGKFLYKRSSH